MFRVIITFAICWSSVFAEKNFWNNEICTTDRDCSGLRTCDTTFGCTLSPGKVGLVMIGVFGGLFLLCLAFIWLCRHNLQRNYQHRPQTVITTTPSWNHQQMPTTVYPHNPYSNQFYANSINPPMTGPTMAPYSQYPPMGSHPINTVMGNSVNMQTAPYPPVGMGFVVTDK
ncbi:hypothetical protein Bhyg_05227 [Pseudolycoriella hygida]|uniref:Uncharacterized protein n=1 Tax=Pseudolycoriella hygida TaxID=35572 RepID=A0A9Q0NHS5_9DIPT|nr:hypothetical protein Bhyg_05227 [Pseudolycoriella hygida]